MIELTKRERFLIYILMCFLIAVAGWFFFLSPTLDKNAELKVTRENNQMQLITLQQELKSVEEAPEQLEILEERYTKITNQYNKIMTNDNIDKLLTSQVLYYGMSPKSMTISELTDVSFDKEQKESKSIIQQSTVTMTLEGNLANLKKLIDSLEDIKGVEIGQFQYMITEEKESVVLSFVIYMIDK